MTVNKPILQQIKGAIGKVEPHATVILYGSYARGDVNNDSDINLLVLLDKDKITRDDERKIFDPLYDIELSTGILISPIIYARDFWKNRHNATPFYENIEREGVIL